MALLSITYDSDTGLMQVFRRGKLLRSELVTEMKMDVSSTCVNFRAVHPAAEFSDA